MISQEKKLGHVDNCAILFALKFLAVLLTSLAVLMYRTYTPVARLLGALPKIQLLQVYNHFFISLSGPVFGEYYSAPPAHWRSVGIFLIGSDLPGSDQLVRNPNEFRSSLHLAANNPPPVSGDRQIFLVYILVKTLRRVLAVLPSCSVFFEKRAHAQQEKIVP